MRSQQAGRFFGDLIDRRRVEVHAVALDEQLPTHQLT